MDLFLNYKTSLLYGVLQTTRFLYVYHEDSYKKKPLM